MSRGVARGERDKGEGEGRREKENGVSASWRALGSTPDSSSADKRRTLGHGGGGMGAGGAARDNEGARAT